MRLRAPDGRVVASFAEMRHTQIFYINTKIAFLSLIQKKGHYNEIGKSFKKKNEESHCF